ncbi:MAG: hypothetical protein II474_07030 [Firmicutes bacterium]|nr:hypothetical protein [Bacillota bacterium]
MFKPLFGNLFDLDGDGQATFEEELIGLHIMDEMGKAREKDDLFGDDEFGDDGSDDDF